MASSQADRRVDGMTNETRASFGGGGWKLEDGLGDGQKTSNS